VVQNRKTNEQQCLEDELGAVAFMNQLTRFSDEKRNQESRTKTGRLGISAGSSTETIGFWFAKLGQQIQNLQPAKEKVQVGQASIDMRLKKINAEGLRETEEFPTAC
jgi:hypothetical protein